MSTSRLLLALERLQPSDWERFEKLSSAFLASDFDDVRTTASPSGDGGRDSELFAPKAEPAVLIQYSVTADWKKKVRKTAKRLQDTFPDASILVFVSNQEIGAQSDTIRRELRRDYGLSLDIRDRNWFTERVGGSRACEIAAEELAQAIVDPLLAKRGIGPSVASELSKPETVAAVTLLGLQLRDEQREKGLTRVAFEALCRAILVDTTGKNRLARKEVHEGVLRLLPGHDPTQVIGHVDRALRKLTKRSIRHWQKEDQFCLSFEEEKRIREFQAEGALAEQNLARAIIKIRSDILPSSVSGELAKKFDSCLRAATDSVLLERSQVFAMAVQSGEMRALATSDYESTLIAAISRAGLRKTNEVDWLSSLRVGVHEVLMSSDPTIHAYMRSLSDSYTLLAFLRQTPDVQSAVDKMFSQGQIWLDTSILLPLFAEPLLEDASGQFTSIVRASRSAGLDLFVTPGVVEEVERHMNRALACSEMQVQAWRGGVPYLFERYVSSGGSPSDFSSWLQEFRGSERPLQDISDFLEDEFGMQTRGLEKERDSVDEELRYALERIWYETHSHRRRRAGAQVDEMVITRLVRHDVESYCGVLGLRREEKRSAFGYSAWWLTLDKEAFRLKEKIKEEMGANPPSSPVLSADFLVSYLAFGPKRSRVGRLDETALPLLLELGSTRYFTEELLADAEAVRNELKGMPERVVRREVRDRMDRARRRFGPIAYGGLAGVDEQNA